MFYYVCLWIVIVSSITASEGPLHHLQMFDFILTLHLLQISIVSQHQRWGLCKNYCHHFCASAQFFFYSKFHWKSWTEIFFLVGVTKGGSFFLNLPRAVSLWCCLLCIFFLVFLPPSAAVKSLNSKSRSRVSLFFFFFLSHSIQHWLLHLPHVMASFWR